MKKILLALLIAYNAANVHGMHLRNKQIMQANLLIDNISRAYNDGRANLREFVLSAFATFDGIAHRSGVISYIARINEQQFTNLLQDSVAVANNIRCYSIALTKSYIKKWLTRNPRNIMVSSEFAMPIMKNNIIDTANTDIQKIAQGIALINDNALAIIQQNPDIMQLPKLDQLYHRNTRLIERTQNLVYKLAEHGLDKDHQHFLYQKTPYTRQVTDFIPIVTAFLMPHYHNMPIECNLKNVNGKEEIAINGVVINDKIIKFPDAAAKILSIFGDIQSAVANDVFHIKERFKFNDPEGTSYQVFEFRQNIDLTLNHDVRCVMKIKNGANEVTQEFNTNLIRLIVKRQKLDGYYRIIKTGTNTFAMCNNIDLFQVTNETANDFIPTIPIPKHIAISDIISSQEFISVFPLKKWQILVYDIH